MKRFLLTLFCALALSTIGAWAETYSVKISSSSWSTSKLTNTLTDQTTKVSAAWTLNATMKTASHSLNLSNDTNSPSRGLQIGSGNKPVKELTISTSDIKGSVTSIKVNTHSASSGTINFSATVGGVAFKSGSSSSVKINATTTYDDGNITMTGEASGDIVLKWNQPSTSKAIYLAEIEITYTTGPTAVENLTFSPLSVNYGDRAEFTVSPAGFVSDVTNLTLTPETKGIVDIVGLKYEAKNAGTTKVDVSWGEGTNYKAGTASFYFTVNTLKPHLSWSPQNLVLRPGDEVSLPVLTNSVSSLTPEFKSSNPEVATVDAEGKVALAGGIGVTEITATIAAVEGQNEADEASCFITVTDKNVAEFGYAVETATVALGSDDALPVLNNPKNLAYTLTSSDPDVAALSPLGDGALWVLAEGTATVTAKFAGDDSTEAATASYTLTVGPAKPAVETKTATFDFTKAGAYGMVAQSGSSTIYNETEAKPSFSFNDGGDLSITTNKVGGKASRLWTNSDNTKFEWRVMNGATFTITAPENGAINSVVFVKGNVTSSARFNIKHKDGNTETSLTNMTWSATEPVNGITFISSGDRSDIASITVTYTKPGAPSAKSAGLSFSDVEREVLVGEITPVEGVSVDADAAALVGYKILDASGNEVESADVEPSTDAAGMVDILADELGEYTLMAYVAPGQGFLPAIAKTIVSVRETICPVALYMHGHFGNRYYKLDEPVVMQKNGKIFTASGILIGGNKDVTDGDLGYVFTTHLPQSTVSRAAHDSDWSQLTEGNVYHAGGVAKAVDINSQDDLTPYTVDKEGLYDITADFSDPAAPDFNAEYIDTTTGIEGVSVSENGVVEYFDLTGRRVENPSAGVYIRRTGSEIQKIMLR